MCIYLYIYIIIPTTDKYPSTCAVPLLHECMLLCNYHPNNKCTYHLKKKKKETYTHTHDTHTHTQKTNNALYLGTEKHFYLFIYLFIIIYCFVSGVNGGIITIP